jgi:cytochrome subunit of sulfide dehydrogenase
MRSRIVVLAILGVAPWAAFPQDGPAARNLAATCANCHGTDGRSVSTEVALLAGLPKEFIVSQMKAFREGSRPATIMHQLAKGYTDQQIDLIATFFAVQKQ